MTGLVIGLGLAVGGAQAAPPAVDAVSSGSANTPLTITVSHTTSGTDRLMLVGVSHNNSGGETVSSVTYNGVSLDFVGQNANSATRIEIWKLVAPPTVTANVVVTFSATLIRGAVVGVMTFTGVDQTTPLGTYSGNAGGNAAATIDVASAADELVFGVVAAAEDGCPIAVGGGQTEHWSDSVGAKPCAAGSTEAGAATVTMSWSLSTGDDWSIGGVSIKPGGGGGDATFNYLAAPVDVTPGTAGSWVDVNVSAWVPAGATGVILQEVNPHATNRYEYGVRNNGSTDTWMNQNEQSRQDSLGFHMIGIDANRIFEVYTESTVVRTYLLGYTMEGVTFFVNAIDKSISTTGSFTDIDISADTGADTAIGAVFVVKETERAGHDVALRMKGSSDNLYGGIDKGDAAAAIIGLDANEVAQMKIDSTFVDLYLVGYVTSGAVFFTNAVNKATSTTGSYVDVDITGDIGSDDATGAILALMTSGEEYFAVRPNGATYDHYQRIVEAQWPVIGIDANDIFEQKISSTSHDLYLAGYTLAGAPSPPTISSVTNQSFFVGDAVTVMSQVTVTDSGGTITAANDIRIRIPAGFNMVWDSTDLTAAIGGAAQSKVSATVTYEDSDATLVLDVTGNFVASDVISVAGLSFTNFTAASASGNLELEIYNDNIVTATDDKTIQINSPTYRSIGTNSSVLHAVGNASITAGSSIVTFAGGASLPTSIGLGDKLQIGPVSAIARQQTVSGSNGGSSPLTLPSINGGTDQTYVLFIATRSNEDVNTVTGGALTWTEQIEQCGSREQQGIRMWTAQGTPGSFSVSIDWQAAGRPIVAILSRYSGVAAFEDATGQNTSGESGGCTGGTDDDPLELTLTSTVPGSVHLIGANSRNDPITSYTAGYAEVKTDSQGSSGNLTILTTYDKPFDPAGTELFQGFTFDTNDWVTAGVVLTPVSSTTFHILSRDSDTQVTVQATAGSTLTNDAYTIERAYNTMPAWEDDRQGDLVAANRREIGVCYNDGAFTDRLVISGSTTNAKYYMRLTVAAGERHNGMKNTGAVIDAQAGWGDLNAIDVENEYTRIEWLEIKDIHDTGHGVYFAPAGDNGTVHGIFVHSFGQSNNAGVEIDALNVTVRNSFFTGGSSYGIRFLDNSTGAVENCTLYGSPGSGSGIGDGVGTTVSIKNTISVNHDAGWDFALYSNIAYFGNNMYSQTTGFDPNVQDGGNQQPPSTNLEYLFVDLTTDDFHLETTGHKAGNTGLDLSGDFTDDIDGVTRVVTWDIGADEGVAGIDPLPPRIVFWTEVEP